MAPPKRGRKSGSGDIDEDYVVQHDSDYEELPSSGRRKSATQKRGRKKAAAVAPSVIHTTSISQGAIQEQQFQDFSKTLVLKSDHASRPVWITQDNLIYLEAFSPLYHQAYDFLVAIAEPESRPEFIHTYKLTENSLYAAVAVSIDTESIIKVLNRLCKTNVPVEVEEYIRKCTYTFGKAKIVLKDNSFHIESKYPEILRELLKNPVISNARATSEGGAATGSSSSSAVDLTGSAATVATGTSSITTASSSSSSSTATAAATTTTATESFLESAAPVEDSRNLDYTKLGREEMDNEDDYDDDTGRGNDSVGDADAVGYKKKMNNVSFKISRKLVQVVKRSAKEVSKYPLMEEYDFKNDVANTRLSIDLRPSTKIRPYQEKSLSKMFGNGRARSGIIVLPCGAGKSLTGVTAASTIKRSCIVLCINSSSVKQWKEQFVTWTNVSEKRVHMFTSKEKEKISPLREACIVITTYSMVCHGGRRSAAGDVIINAIAAREWGLMILDEVHVAPADMFQKVVININAHCKLGLTATLVREDNKIKDLSFLVGPKLYEANWIDLTEQGFLAKVQCVEVWCPMTKEFYVQYIQRSFGSNDRLCRLLYALNPRKFRTCEYLVDYHTKRGDKIIIFSDDVPALILYCEALKQVKEIPYIYGETKEEDRRTILTAFKTSPEVSCIGLSKVGDTALDIPEANVIIQISSHFGARRQEAQRLGRILRPKPNPTGAFNAFFYTLISTDTKEMFFSMKRQQYLIDQGYTFKVVQTLADVADKESILLRTKKQEMDLLNKVISFNCGNIDDTEESELSRRRVGEVDEDGSAAAAKGTASASGVRRKVSSLNTLSAGNSGTVYTEFDV